MNAKKTDTILARQRKQTSYKTLKCAHRVRTYIKTHCKEN